MDKAVFAIVAGSEAESDKQIREDLQKYFLPLIEEGREFIVSEVMKDGAEEEYEEEDAANDD
jgi:hypothetical protein